MTRYYFMIRFLPKEANLRISVNPISDSGVIRSPANRSFS